MVDVKHTGVCDVDGDNDDVDDDADEGDDDAMAEAVHLARAPELDEIQHARETHDYNVITF
jgi:hypothetical protein